MEDGSMTVSGVTLRRTPLLPGFAGHRHSSHPRFSLYLEHCRRANNGYESWTCTFCRLLASAMTPRGL